MASPPSLLLLLLLLLLVVTARPPLASADAQTTYTNITLGIILSPLGPNSSLTSPSGDFAFGFHPLNSTMTLFLLAVWFDKTPNKTLAWYANPDYPVPVGSTMELTNDGRLSLKDPSGKEVWNPGPNGASYAAILDTGNLVLCDSHDTPMWQSFSSPTDTILPSQILPLNTSVWSRLMDDDYTHGRFRLEIQGDGNLVLYAVSSPYGIVHDAYQGYWESNTVGNGTQLVFNQSGSIYFKLKDGPPLGFTSSTETTKDYYLRGTLDPDGVFRHYIYPRAGNGVVEWTAVAFIPSDICSTVNLPAGSGACGFNSYCRTSGDAIHRVDCACPPQYSFVDTNRKYKGCKPDFAAQSCEAGSAAGFKFTELINVDWPFREYETFKSIGKDECQDLCLNDCSCAVAVYQSGGCWKKDLPLPNGRTGTDVVSLVKVAVFNSSMPASEKKHQTRSWTIALVSSILGFSVIINALLAAVISMAAKRRFQRLQPEILSTQGVIQMRCFTCRELEEVTNGFSDELGSGAFGRVYKGHLKSEPNAGAVVAVKRLHKDLQEETVKEFDNEIRSIGQTHHKNLVRLVGFCNEGNERMLVYEYMSNGSLTGYLFSGNGGRRPPWEQRVKIAAGIARGLLYLHEECSSQIIHCDIKPQNVLLDANFNAKISDFGLAKLLRADQTRTLTGIRGTRGYVAPEWFRGLTVTAKVDVYSFGVVLLEVVCCRRNVDVNVESEEEVVLAYWAYDCYSIGRVAELVEGDVEALEDVGAVDRMVKVAFWCIQDEPARRPSMQRVVQMLEGAVEIPIPPNPTPVELLPC